MTKPLRKRICAQLAHATLAGILLAAASSCSIAPERRPVPSDLTKNAAIPGIPGARFWGDQAPAGLLQRLEDANQTQIRAEFPDIYGKPHNYLAISGGGANGAFGAGLLVGWTAAGSRPEFTMVTGVSTGALTAPFAFLGPDFDDRLEEVYTTVSTSDIVVRRSLLTVAFGDSIVDTHPLRNLIARYVNDEVIDAIAREHQRGRRLFIGTFNLDAARPVIWNIGAIAVSDYSHKYELIQEILLASTSIPVAFPPVLIEVEADGGRFDEMHVDGGTGAQVFVYPSAVDWPRLQAKLRVTGNSRVYVIRNAFLEADYRGIKPTLVPIASRSIASLIRTQGVGDLYQIFALAKRDGLDFNLAYIPSTFTEEPEEGFDPVYMTKLYRLGYRLAVGKSAWHKTPPGFATETYTRKAGAKPMTE